MPPARTAGPPAVTIVIPAFGAAAQLEACLESLARCIPRDCPVLVADDATPDESVADVARRFESRLRLSYVRREQNLGFVANCNDAIQSVLPSGRDVLLLNSDTRVTEGFLDEMSAVLHLHERHGAVSPRSNNATIFSVPVAGGLPPEDAYQLWSSIRGLLPRYQVMPTAVGFCMLIKNVVLQQLGAFDPVYSPGYNEENDFVCRINRHGYSAVAANRAFVFHDESSSFGARRRDLERRNRELLISRYPEYVRKVAHHLRYGVDPVDHFGMLWRKHRPSILIDLFHLPAKHSGTSEFALNLLLHLAPILEREAVIRLGLSAEARRVFGPELTGYRFYDADRDADLRFDLAFKPAQIFSWNEFRRLVRLGGRIAYTHLDIIAVRCDYLSGPNTRAIFRTAAELSDRVLTISEFSKSDFEAFYDVSAGFDVIHLGALGAEGPRSPGAGHILIVGNHFHHKAVLRAVEELRGVGDLVAIGGAEAPPGVRWLASGDISRARLADLYTSAAVVVYPSFYEGFGMPIVDAVANGTPVVALDTVVNREVCTLIGGSRLVLVRDHGELRTAVSAIVSHPPAKDAVAPSIRGWGDVARDYGRSLLELLGRDLDVGLIRRRWELLTTIDAVHPLMDQDSHPHHDIDALIHERNELRAELQAAYTSRSWWLTAPLRRLLRALR
jgi:GT2 family glycosyltransferase